MDTASYTGKNDGVWWGIFKEYLKQNIITTVLRKANAPWFVIFRLIKKINYVKKNKKKTGKISSNFAYEVLIKRNLM